MPPRRTRDSSPIATNGSGRRRRTPSSSRPRESSSRQASSGDRDSRDNMVVGSTSNHNKKPSRHQETKQRDDDHRNRRASSGKTRHQSQSSNSHSNSQQRRPSQRRSSSKRSPSPVRTYRQGHASPIKGSPDRPSKSQSHSRSHNSNSHSRHRTMDHSDRQQIQGHKSPYQEDKDKSHSNSKSHRSSSTRPKKVQLKRSSTTDGHREDFGHGHSRRSSTSHRSSSTRGHVDIVDHSRSDKKLNSSYNEKHSSQSQQRSSRGHVDIVDHSRSESKLSSSYNEKHSQPQQQQLRPSSDVKLSSSYNEKKSQSSQQQQPRPSSSSRGLPDDLRRSTGSGYSDSHHHHRSYTSKSSTGSGRSHNEQRSLDFDAHAHRRQSSSDGNHHHHHQQQQQQQSQQRPRPVSSSRSMDERRENDNRSTPVPSSSKSYHGSPITKSTSQPTPKRTTKKTNSSSASDAVDRLLAQAEGCLAPTRADARRKSVSSKSASADHVDRLLACAEECLVNNPSPNSTNNNGRNTPSSSTKDTRGRDKSVNSIISRISRVRQQASRSRSKSRDGRLSSMMRSKSGERSTNGSAVTLATKSISSSGSQAEHLAREILTVSKCPVTPPSSAPRRPPPPLHRSASVGALGNQGDLGGQLCLVPYNGGEGSQGPMSTTRSHQSSSIALNESREGALSPRNHAPPPPPYTKRMSCSDIQLRHSLSNNDFSPGAGSYNAVNRKPTPPPPPPPRRPASRASMTASGISLNNITEDTSYNHGNATDANYNNGNAMPMYNGPINPPPQQTAIIPFAEITTTNNDDNSNPTKGGKKDLNKPRETHLVSQMSYTDHHGDTGIYTGEVDNESRPHGKGKMRYDNGIFYEGNWIHGKQDHAQGTSDQMANVTRERIMSGFTSWKGQRSQKNLKEGIGDQGTYVYGMEWVDRTGMAGKYTGHVDANDDPDGKGIMRYEFGLVAEGEWIKGVLNDGQGMGAMGAATVAAGGGMTVAPGGAMSVAPGMSVAGGGQTVVSGLGMMSIVGGGMGMGGMGCGFPRAGMGGGMGMMNPYMGGMNAMQATPSVAPMSYYQPVGAGMMAGAGSVAPSQYGGMMYHPQQGTGMGGGMNVVPTNLAAPQEQRQLL